MSSNVEKNGHSKKQNREGRKFGRKTLAYFKSWDMFGHPVGLSIQGEEEFKTYYGSIATLLLTIYMLFVLYVAFEPIAKNKVKTSYT